MRSKVLGVVVALLVALSACSSDEARRVCTLIGCQSGVSYRIADEVSEDWPRPLVVEVCIDEHCDTTVIASEQMVAAFRTRVDLPENIDVNVPHTVSIETVGPDGSILLARTDTVTLAPHTPNGSDCPPTCWSATVVVATGG